MSSDTITLSTVLNRDEADEASPLTLIGELDPSARGTFDQRVLKSGQSVTAYNDDRFKASLADVSSDDTFKYVEEMLHHKLRDALLASGANCREIDGQTFLDSAVSFVTDLEGAFDKRGETLEDFFDQEIRPEIFSTANNLLAFKAGMKKSLETYTGCERDVRSVLDSAVSKLAKKYSKAFATPPAKMADRPTMSTINGSDELLRQIDTLPNSQRK